MNPSRERAAIESSLARLDDAARAVSLALAESGPDTLDAVMRAHTAVQDARRHVEAARRTAELRGRVPERGDAAAPARMTFVRKGGRRRDEL